MYVCIFRQYLYPWLHVDAMDLLTMDLGEMWDANLKMADSNQDSSVEQQ